MIELKKLKWKNFLSTGNLWTEIELDKHPTTLIIGTNGSGKSTMLDALTFALFGKPFRKINIPQLINSINEKECVVEIEFNISKNKYKVVRGLKPRLLEIYCNDKLLDQESKNRDNQDHLEKNILKLNYKTFTQVVILGSSSYTPFMQLSAADRRSVIEYLLDIEIFSAMNIVLKQKQAETKNDLDAISQQYELTKQKLEIIKSHINSLREDTEKRLQDIQEKIKLNDEAKNDYLGEISRLEKEISEYNQSIIDMSSVESKYNEYVDYQRTLDGKLRKIQKDLKFFEKNTECPTCKQAIDEEFRQEKINSRRAKIDEIESGLDKLGSKISSTSARLKEIGTISKNISNKTMKIREMMGNISAINGIIEDLNKSYEDLKNEQTPTTNEQEQTLNFLENDITNIENKKSDLIEYKHYYDISAALLKDSGIKTKIIKQYLPIINKMVNKYLSHLDFFVNFQLNESFEETIKSRFRDDFSYASFSEGEKLRIDLALLFTWRDVAKIKNSSNTNLLILDEIFDSSLDSAGTEEFMKLIYNLNENVNVFVISHKTDTLIDKFKNVIKFEKIKNFSKKVSENGSDESE